MLSMLPLLDDDITLRITKSAITGTPDPLLEELGLTKEGCVTEKGEKIWSLYPFFGSGTITQKRYPSLIFSFILGGMKGDVGAFFPYISINEIKTAALWIESGMKKLGLIMKDRRVNLEAARAFMSLTTPERLSYIISAEKEVDAEKAKRALFILSSLNGLRKEEAHRITEAVYAYSSVSLDIEEAIDMGIVYEENGLYTSYDMTRYPSSGFSLSSDMTILYPGNDDKDIYLMASPVSYDGNTSRWVITKESIRRAFDLDLTSSKVISILRGYSSYGLSDSLINQIESWEREYSQIRITNGTIVRVEPRFAPLFSMAPLKDYITDTLAEGVYIVDPSSLDDMRQQLGEYGISTPSRVRGPEFSKEVKPAYNFHPLENDMKVPSEREITFDKSAYTALLKSAENPFERILVSSHLYFGGNEKERFQFTDGLDYQKKRSLILEAMRKGNKIYILYVDGSSMLAKPFSADGDRVSTDNGSLAISKIWKVTQLPGFVTSETAQVPSDSDTP